MHDIWILRIIWNSKFHFRLQKHLKGVSILIYVNPIHTLPLYFSNIHFTIFLPSTLVSSKSSFSFRVSSQNPLYIFLTHTCRMNRPAQTLFCSPEHYLVNIKNHKAPIMQFSPVSCFFLPLLITLFLNTLSLYSSRNVSNQVSHPYERKN